MLQTPTSDLRCGRNRAIAIVLALAFFIALAPTLGMCEFSNSMENLVVATSMEMHRDNIWLVPTLQGEMRVAKPPLAAWITAASIRPQTLRDIDSMDYDLRRRAFHPENIVQAIGGLFARGTLSLSVESRWPALLAASLLILGVFELGTIVRDSKLGLAAAAICASSYFIQRFSRFATTDIYLALWVTWTNVFLARAILRGKTWSGLIGAAIALGMAMMSKGPVSLIESVVPAAVFVFVPPRQIGSLKRLFWPAVAGAIVFLVTGFWWFALIVIRKEGVLDLWYSEVFRGASGRKFGTPIFTYFGVVYFVLPWTVFLIVGLLTIWRQIVRREKTSDLFAALLLILPLVVITFAKDRQDRYALPMIPAAAVVIAVGVRQYLQGWLHPDRYTRATATLHWFTLAVIVVLIPILGTTPLLKQEDGKPWFSLSFGYIEGALGAMLLVTGIRLHQRRPGALVAMTCVTMLVMQAVLFKGYCSTDSGRSDMKQLADALAAQFPDATFYNAHPEGKRPPTDMGVYLNRTIQWVANPSQLSATPHPLVLFMLQNNGQPDPAPPQEWHFVQKAKKDKDWWWAFVLPPI
jgi:4-amino-4-deoxy-L-arabinose transferase-like glycosyltransferase